MATILSKNTSKRTRAILNRLFDFAPRRRGYWWRRTSPCRSSSYSRGTVCACVFLDRDTFLPIRNRLCSPDSRVCLTPSKSCPVWYLDEWTTLSARTLFSKPVGPPTSKPSSVITSGYKNWTNLLTMDPKDPWPWCYIRLRRRTIERSGCRCRLARFCTVLIRRVKVADVGFCMIPVFGCSCMNNKTTEEDDESARKKT